MLSNAAWAARRRIFTLVWCLFTCSNIWGGNLEEMLIKARKETPEKAIEIFEEILGSKPDWGVVRMDLADAYRKTSEFDLAERNARIVLQQPDIPDTVRSNVKNFLARVERDRQAEMIRLAAVKHKWESSISLSMGYDDNVNAGPGGETIPLTIGDITLTQDVPAKQNDFYSRVIGKLDHSYELPTFADKQNWAANLLLESGIALFRQSYFTESEFNSDFVSLRLGPTLVKPEAWEVKLHAQYDFLRLDDRKLADFYSINPSTVWQPWKHLRLLWIGAVQRRDYSRSEDQDRDSTYGSVGITSLLTSKDKRWLFSIGGTVSYEDAREERFDEWESQLDAEVWFIRKSLDLYGKGAYRKSVHQGREPLFNRSRNDDEIRLEAGGIFRMRGWEISILGKYTNVDSNIPLFEYSRNQAELSARYRW